VDRTILAKEFLLHSRSVTRFLVAEFLLSKKFRSMKAGPSLTFVSRVPQEMALLNPPFATTMMMILRAKTLIFGSTSSGRCITRSISITMGTCRSRAGIVPLPPLGSHRLNSKWLRLSGPTLIPEERSVASGERSFQGMHLPLLGTMLDTSVNKGIYEILSKSLCPMGQMQKWVLATTFASATKTCNGPLEVSITNSRCRVGQYNIRSLL
jgi:hypothetical protein